MAVQDCMYRYEPVRTLLATWQYEKAQNGTYRYVLPPVIPRLVCQARLAYTGMYCLVPAWYKVVQGGTRWYKVVQGGTRWYMTLQATVYGGT